MHYAPVLRIYARESEMEGLPTQILEFAPTALVSLDPAGRIVFANPAAARLISSGPVEDLIGQPIRTYIQFLNVGSAGEDECIRDDGSSFPIEYESAPMLEDGRAIGTVVTLRDISERRAADVHPQRDWSVGERSPGSHFG